MHRATTLLAAAFALGAAPAFAGNLTPPADDIVTPPPPPVAATPNWTGLYGGVQLGYNNLDSNISGGDDTVIGGLFVGYDYDFGNFVLGSSLDYDFTEAEVSTAPNPQVDLENIFRAKLRAGYKLGNGLIYGTGGYAKAFTDNLGDDDGYFVGAGYETMVTDSFSLGGELLYHEFDNFNGSNADVEPTTVQLRGTFRF
ncbi:MULTISPECIES: outer membrane protein [unclassified Roseovarius]|uniref:outer membrane protein n=1 Tax=unclassified Roseovarius TaxID=2614913 RepID=UPI00273FB7E0|nr:outer membrane beta-barrel protein [Roseovarius sp. MMSF_3350]